MGNEVQIVTKKRTKSIIFVLFSNIISLVSGILIGFIVPKMMDLNNYGIYKIYTLYITYLPIFHFGFATGIYIKYGGCDYNELDKNRFRSYFKYLFLLQFVISLVFIVFSLIFSSNEYRFIIIMLSFLLISNNLTNYFQLISQITERYFELSIRNILLSLCNIVLIVFYFILDKFTDFQLTCYTYIISSIIINYVLTIWYIITYRNIIFGKSEKVSAKELINIH